MVKVIRVLGDMQPDWKWLESEPEPASANSFECNAYRLR
jgi:hypothetical protein